MVKKFYILLTEYSYVWYVPQKKKTLKFFLYSSQSLMFITEETSVYCAVQTGSLNKPL